jgi:sigma-B regulation protein RsbU (phosphoserine phosphatase)
MRILIAEDERITRMTLARQLTSWGHQVTAAEDGQQAWERLSAPNAEFDFVITDWEMPRLSGVELVRHIRQDARRSAYTYVILLTSRSEKADIVKGIEAGADDFVSKPFDRDELRVRLLAGERIVNLERALSRQNAELRDANTRIRVGLQAAARVQQSMLPRQNIVTPRARTAWKYVPTDELAGDAIGLHLIDDRYLVAYVVDVSGHGVPAALLAVSAMHAMEPIPEATSLLRDMTAAGSANDLGTVRRPGRVATELNRSFRASENDGRYLTMILCVLDTQQGRLHIARAGHPEPFVLRGSQSIPVPDAGGFPIALVDDAEYEDITLLLQPGDRVCMFSDGILEQSVAAGSEQFGWTRLLEFLTARSDTPIDGLVTQVADELARWAASAAFTDDVSLVIVEWLGDG